VAISYNPSIVTSGLQVYLDAANTKSYPGSGASWLDLTGNGNHFTLVNSPTWSSASGGVFETNGTTSAITSSYSTSKYTIMSATRIISGGRMLTALNNNWLLGHHSGAGPNYYAAGWINNQYSLAGSSWHIWTGTGDTSTDTWSMWYDNTFVVQNSLGVSGPSGFNIGGYSGERANGQISFLIIYNSVLSSNEILQNYNALRGRFGL
jgi:hypothetical protein